MAVGVQLETSVKLKQELRLTPEMRVGLELLALPVVDLEARLEEEVARNPALEWPDEALETPIEAFRAHRTQERRLGPDFARDRELPDYDPFERLDTGGPGLRAHLRQQAEMSPWSEAERDLVLALIPYVDPEGYLRESDAELAELLQVDAAAVARARSLLQTLEPTGVGARDLCECLLLQLEEAGEAEGLAARILREALAELEGGDLEAIAERLGVATTEVERALARLRRLDPRPGLRYRDDLADYLRPELAIVRQADGSYAVVTTEVVERRRPRINPAYRQLLERAAELPEALRRDLQRYVREGEALIQNLQRREITMLRVTEAIVRHQWRMLEEGPEAAVPLTLRDIAMELDLSESTVSRATRGRYVVTPRGIMELKRFFVKGVDGNAPEQIKRRIRALIEGEDPAKPLSDDAIAKRLALEGIRVARRTVAKYRESMGIPSTTVRRRRARAV